MKVETARGSAPSIQAVLSGTALLTRCGRLESLLAIADRGAPINCVAFTTRRSPLAIVSAKSAPLNEPGRPQGQAHRHPVGGRHQRDDARPADRRQRPHDARRAASGHGLHAGHVRADQEEAASPASSSAPRRSSSSGVGARRDVHADLGLRQRRRELHRLREGARREQGHDRPLPEGGARARCSRSSPTSRNKYADTIKKLRSKYDFAELENDAVASSWIDFLVTSWTKNGKDQLLKTDPKQWKETYDAAVEIKAAKAGVDVSKNLSAVAGVRGAMTQSGADATPSRRRRPCRWWTPTSTR